MTEFSCLSNAKARLLQNDTGDLVQLLFFLPPKLPEGPMEEEVTISIGSQQITVVGGWHGVTLKRERWREICKAFLWSERR